MNANEYLKLLHKKIYEEYKEEYKEYENEVYIDISEYCDKFINKVYNNKLNIIKLNVSKKISKKRLQKIDNYKSPIIFKYVYTKFKSQTYGCQMIEKLLIILYKKLIKNDENCTVELNKIIRMDKDLNNCFLSPQNDSKEYNNFNCDELKKELKKIGKKGFSKLRKKELIELLENMKI